MGDRRGIRSLRGSEHNRRARRERRRRGTGEEPLLRIRGRVCASILVAFVGFSGSEAAFGYYCCACCSNSRASEGTAVPTAAAMGRESVARLPVLPVVSFLQRWCVLSTMASEHQCAGLFVFYGSAQHRLLAGWSLKRVLRCHPAFLLHPCPRLPMASCWMRGQYSPEPRHLEGESITSHKGVFSGKGASAETR